MKLLSLLKNLRWARAKGEDFLLSNEKIPSFVAIIMDGNGRWAASRHLPAIAGHREGSRALKRVISAAKRAGVQELTVYAFSTENWRRPAEEVEALMEMFSEMVSKEVPELHEQDIRVAFIGRRPELSQEIQNRMAWAEQLTAANGSMTLFVAFNYGGRAEVIDAVNAAAADGVTLTEDNFDRYLYAPQMHAPELMIRTSGEHRISNFLLWQSAYAELYFCDKLWPDFSEEDFLNALNDFSRRQRRFGAR